MVKIKGFRQEQLFKNKLGPGWGVGGWGGGGGGGRRGGKVREFASHAISLLLHDLGTCTGTNQGARKKGTKSVP